MKSLGRLICIGFLVLMVYSGLMFGMPFYRYYAFKSAAGEMIRFEVEKDEDMIRHFMDKAHDLGIPVEEKNILLGKKDGSYIVNASWSETVNMLNRYKRKLDFSFVEPGSR